MKTLIERTFRRYLKICFSAFYLIISFVCMIPMGLSFYPALLLGTAIYNYFHSSTYFAKILAYSMSIPLLFFIYGLTLITVTPLMNWALQLNKRVKKFKGSNYSTESISWFLHNGLTYIVRYTFLEFVTPSPFNIFFYRAMGMKIGENVIINTTNISDPCLITLEDNVTVGGGAYLLAHYSIKGKLYISPLIVRKGATLGLKSTVFGNNDIPENFLVRPHEVVLPKKDTPVVSVSDASIAPLPEKTSV